MATPIKPLKTTSGTLWGPGFVRDCTTCADNPSRGGLCFKGKNDWSCWSPKAPPREAVIDCKGLKCQERNCVYCYPNAPLLEPIGASASSPPCKWVCGCVDASKCCGEDRCLGLDPIDRPIHNPIPEGPVEVSTNPKKAFGVAKPPLHLVPSSAIVAMSVVMKDGARKYGPYNWRETNVDVSTYVAAAKRHLDLFWNGQDEISDNPEGGLNLAAVMSCCAILIDAHVSGVLIDDRPPPQELETFFDRYTVGKGLPAPAVH